MAERIVRGISKCIFLLFFAVLCTCVPQRTESAGEIEKLRTDLNSSDWQVRRAAVEQLTDFKNDEVFEMLMEVAGTRSEYWPVKIKAIKLLGDSGDPRAISLLLSIFNDTFLNWECPAIKSYAAIAMGNFKGDKKIVEALISGVDDPDLLIREASVQSLGRVGDARAVPSLIPALGDQNIAVRLGAVKALENIGDPSAIPELLRVSEDEEDPDVKNAALSALKKLNKQE